MEDDVNTDTHRHNTPLEERSYTSKRSYDAKKKTNTE